LIHLPCDSERDSTLYPIEVKFNSRPKPKDARGFKSLRENYPNAKIAPGLILALAEQEAESVIKQGRLFKEGDSLMVSAIR